MKGIILAAIVWAYFNAENASAQSSVKTLPAQSSELQLIRTSELTDLHDVRFAKEIKVLSLKLIYRSKKL